MRNIDYVVKVISKEKQIPEDKVAKVLDFYWAEVKSELSTFEHEALFLRNLGTFQLSYTLLCREAKGLIAKIRKMEAKPEGERKSGNMRKFLSDILKLRSQISKTFYGKFKHRLGEPKTNSGGNQE